MKATLFAMFVALLMIGCGGDAEYKIQEARESGATKLDLYRSEISDLSPLKELTNLKTLWLSDNSIPDDQKAMLKKALPDCKISF